MLSIGIKLMNGIEGSLIAASFAATSAALGGYTYAKFANLPAPQVAAAFAIWHAAEAASLTIAMNFTKHLKSQKIIKATILTLSSFIGIKELQKQGLLGSKMIMVVAVIRAVGICLIIGSLINKKETS